MLVNKQCGRGKSSTGQSTLLDTLLLNPYIGIPLFLGLMYSAFFVTIQIGVPLQTLFEQILQTLFGVYPERLLNSLSAPSWIIELVLGAGKGIVITGCFIPVVGLMFFCSSLLETSGYLARMALLMDRWMQKLGLSGRAFIPLVMGMGCNVPAVLSTRTLEAKAPVIRIKTILMSTFISCSGRLGIYALFAASFFKDTGQNIIFALYLIGILFALGTGWVLRHVLLLKEAQVLPMTLPAYQCPSLGALGKASFHRVKSFVLDAGQIIIPLCLIFSLLTTLKAGTGETWLATVGKTATPIFAPMGVKQDNWPATVGLLTGFMAKEAVAGTLNALYAEEARQLGRSVAHNAGMSTNQNSLALTQKSSLSALMSERFGGGVEAFAYLLFVLLYLPCISVLSAIKRELNLAWAIFSACWTTSLAYAVSVLFYQIATFKLHPGYSATWIMGIVMTFTITGFGVRGWLRALGNPLCRILEKGRAGIRSYNLIPTRILIKT